MEERVAEGERGHTIVRVKHIAHVLDAVVKVAVPRERVEGDGHDLVRRRGQAVARVGARQGGACAKQATRAPLARATRTAGAFGKVSDLRSMRSYEACPTECVGIGFTAPIIRVSAPGAGAQSAWCALSLPCQVPRMHAPHLGQTAPS